MFFETNFQYFWLDLDVLEQNYKILSFCWLFYFSRCFPLGGYPIGETPHTMFWVLSQKLNSIEKSLIYHKFKKMVLEP